jgi:hypothetical protein
MPTPPTYDDLEGVSYDIFFTYDDPLGNHRLNEAYALGVVTRDGPSVAVDWTGTAGVVDGLDAPFAKDRFFNGHPEISNDPFDRTASNGWGTEPKSGVSYVTSGGAASDHAVAGGVATQSHSSINVERIALLNIGKSDCTVVFDFTSPVMPTGGSFRVRVVGRAQDSSNLYFTQLELGTDGIARLGLQRRVAGANATVVANITLGTYLVTDQWRITFSVIGPTLKAYAQSLTRPSLFGQVEGPDTTFTSGTNIGVATVLAVGNTNTLPVVFSWDNQVGRGSTAWPASDFGDAWTLSDALRFANDGTVGVVTATATNTMYSALMASVVTNDYDFMVKVRLLSLMTGAKGSVYLFARYQDANNHWRYRLDFNTDQVVGWAIEEVVSGTPSAVWSGLVPGVNHAVDEWVYLRVQGYGTRIRHKVWNDDIGQSDDWLIEDATDTTFNGLPGSLGLGFKLDSGNTNTTPVTLEVGVFWSGLNDVLDNGQASVTKSLDDGFPTGASDSTNLGVADATAGLLAPIGERSSVFWSTFRSDQPYSDIDRDVAGVAISSSTVASDGIRTTRMFTGQMADVVISDEDVLLKGISRNRLKMSTLVQPPAVHGFYEGGEYTWAIGYALFKSGLYVAPPPIPGCRLYIPMSGTFHPYLPDTNYKAFQAGMVHYPTPGVFVYGPVSFVDGPFPGTAGTDTRIDTTAVRRIDGIASETNLADGDDFWSQRNAVGRIEFWLRGDATDVAGSNDPTASVLGRVLMFDLSVAYFIQVAVAISTRAPSFSISDGVNTVTARHTTPLPTDGKWHFIAGSWDLPNNELRLCIDGSTMVFSASPLSISNLPAVDNVQSPIPSSSIPISEVRVSSGPMASHRRTPWVRDIPWSADVVMRRSNLSGPGFAHDTPREAYDLIADYARAELARTGYDEYDRYMYLPLSYFGEDAQQMISEDLSTATNLGRDFKPVKDVNKIYNQITVKYEQQEQQWNHSAIYESSSLITLPPGVVTTLVLPTNAPVYEVRDNTLPLSILTGTALAAAPPSASNAINYLTANDNQGGTGAYATSAQVSATIVEWNPGSVTLDIRNNTSTTYYIVNNVNLPALALAGKVHSFTAASVVSESAESIAIRRTRVLEANMQAIGQQTDALRMCRELVLRLGFPRVTFTSSVFGDPRRSPGQLVSVEDPDKTNLSGNFRLTNVKVSQHREDLQQSIAGEQALPVLVWGVGKWGEAIWGEAP